MIKTEKYNIRLIIMGVIALAYLIFTIVAFASTAAWHYNAMNDRPSLGLKSVYLSEIPIHQTFTADRLVGTRIWVYANDPVENGSVVVSIGDEETGEVLCRGELPAESIMNSAESKAIDVTSNKELGMIEPAEEYFVEISTQGMGERSVKTLLAIADGEQAYRDGDEEQFEGKKLCFIPLCKSLSDAFVYWIPITGIFLTLMFILVEKPGKDRSADVQIPSGKNFIIAGALMVITLIIFVSSAVTIAKVSLVDSKSEDIAEGYTLHEHSSYVEEFTLGKKKLRAIRVYLPDYLENSPLFVVSLQNGQGDVLATKQSNEMELTGQGGYRLDVSDLELEAGQDYYTYVFTGFIEEGEEEPVLKRIEYEYAK